MLNLLLLIYLIVHIIVCCLIYLGLRTRFFKFTEQLMPVIALVPGAGIIIALIADYNSRRNKVGTRAIEIEELHLGDEDLRLNKIDEDNSAESVIPLEEAMSVNDADVRRRLMQDILRQNPDAYIDLLREARMDDDIEVTHYASTAMMEMQRDYELSLQKAERDYKEKPDDYETVNRYLHGLERYINSGLADENVLFVYRTRYGEVLNKKMKAEPENMAVCSQAVENYLEMGNISEAMALANRMITKWPNRQESWFSKLKVCRSSNDGDGIKDVVHQIKSRNIYLTPEGRSILSFWEGNSKKEV